MNKKLRTKDIVTPILINAAISYVIHVKLGLGLATSIGVAFVIQLGVVICLLAVMFLLASKHRIFAKLLTVSLVTSSRKT